MSPRAAEQLSDGPAVRPYHCVLLDDYLGIKDVCLSLPVVMAKDGITRIIEPDLGEEESTALHESARIVRDAIRESLA